jgi:hypothetical protein
MLAGIGCAFCVLIAILITGFARARRRRTVDKAMRDYVRRAY